MNYGNVFKAYDIRGIYQKEIDVYFAYKLGFVVGKYINNLFGNTGKIFIGSDVRQANNELIKYFIGGLKKSGCINITTSGFLKNMIDGLHGYDYGVCSTPFCYYLGKGENELGVVFTASHNPAEYVGMKFFDKKGLPIDTLVLKELFDNCEDIEMDSDSFDPYRESLSSEYPEKIEKLFDYLNSKFNNISKKVKIAVDFSNGSCCILEKDFFKKIKNKNLEFIFINDYPDGTFPNHEADTLHLKGYDQLKKIIVAYNCDFGIMFDGDGDRIGFIDNNLNIALGDTVTAIIADQILSENKSNIVLYDLRSTKFVKEIIQSKGAACFATKVGHKFIKQDMIKLKGNFAGEVSGHYYFSDVGGFEFSLLALYYMIKGFEKFNDFASLVNNYIKYYKGPEINFTVNDKSKILNTIETEFNGCEKGFLDGISISGDGFRFNIRFSNTENKVRLNLEADNKIIYDEYLEKISVLIKGL